jgi:hypothetical protein
MQEATEKQIKEVMKEDLGMRYRKIIYQAV